MSQPLLRLAELSDFIKGDAWLCACGLLHFIGDASCYIYADNDNNAILHFNFDVSGIQNANAAIFTAYTTGNTHLSLHDSSGKRYFCGAAKMQFPIPDDLTELFDRCARHLIDTKSAIKR